MNAQWTPDQIAYVLKHWTGGRSASEVAADLKTSFGVVRTRNAVIGIVHRQGMSNRPRAARPAKLTTYRPAKAPRIRKVAHTPPKPGQQNRPGDVFGKVSILNPVETEKQRQKHRSYGRDAVANVADGAGVESLNARPWMDRKPFGECRWPLGEAGAIRSCCNPIERGSYCEGHAAVAFVGAPVNNYVSGARFDRVEPTYRRPPTRPTTPWDEARAA